MAATHTDRTLAKQVMTADPICVGPGDAVREVARIFDENSISGAPVVDMQDRLIGIVSKTDILHRALVGPSGSRPSSFFELMAEGLDSDTDLDAGNLGIVEEVMSAEAVTATPEEPAASLARRLAKERVHRIVVVDDTNHPIGIITALDVLNVFPG